MSRKLKLTPEIQDRICAAIRQGNYQETAAKFAGIGETTFYRWLDEGSKEDSDEIFQQFREAVEKAKADAEVRDISLIDKAATDGSWQAAAWKLERKYPHRWGRVTRTEITGAEGAPLKVEVDAKAELKKLLGLGDDSSV